MALLLFLVGALFALLFTLKSLAALFSGKARTTPRVGFWDLFLAYAAALIWLSGLIVNATDEMPDPLIDYATLIACGALAAYSLLLTLLEIFRPARLRGSRGILGLFSAAAIAVSTFTVPFVSAYFTLPPEPAPVGVIVQAATPNPEVTPDPDATQSADATSPEDQARAAALFTAIREAIASEVTNMDEGAVFAQLDAGVPLVTIVEAADGDIEAVIRQITDVMRAAINDSAARGEISRLQAALIGSQMGTFIRIAVNNDLNSLTERFGGPTPDPQATRRSLTDLLTAVPQLPNAARASQTAPGVDSMTGGMLTATRVDSMTGGMPTTTAVPALTTTVTALPTLEPSATRTPRATETPYPTITPLITRALTLTPQPSLPEGETIGTLTPGGGAAIVPRATTPGDLPAPCIAGVNYNLRLRTAPTRDSETIAVIPFGEAIALYGKNADATWWYAEYQGTFGWVDGEFLTIGVSCARLPAR